jgi:uncharacterized integral membrane protein
MRYLKYLFLLVLAASLLTVALANRDLVTLNLLTPELASLVGFGMSITLPLYVVVFGGIAAGILIGFVWEWFREHKHRAEAARRTREAKTLAREVVRLKDKQNEGKDDILALIEDGPRKAG